MGGDQLSALERFLSYGPIGLAGLMLVLVVLALSMRELTEIKAGLLKLFLVVGGLCFAGALTAQFFSVDASHTMRVSILPANLEEKAHTSPPELILDGESVIDEDQHTVDNDIILVIDMTTAVGNAERALSELAAESSKEMSGLIARSKEDIESLRNETRITMQEMEDRIAQVATELEKVRAVQEVLAKLQSGASDIEEFKLTRELNKTIEQFVANIGPIVARNEDKQ